MSESAKSKNRQHNLQVGRKEADTSEAGEPYTSEILEAQKLLEDLKRRKEEEAKAEERRLQIEERKKAFVEFHQEVVSKIDASLPTIDDKVLETNQVLSDLSKAKEHFTASLKNIKSFDPSTWSEADVTELSDKYEEMLEKASSDYDQFVAYISKNTGKKVKEFTRAPRRSGGGYTMSLFGGDLLRGFAFSLPVIVTLVILGLYIGGSN